MSDRPISTRPIRLALVAIASVVAIAIGATRGDSDEIRPGWRDALDRISAESLKGHLSFLASDLLEGRGTPSRGLDLAAEYVAAQFRRAGLEPVGDDGYFQTSDWKYKAPDPGTVACVFKPPGARALVVAEGSVSGAVEKGVEIQGGAVFKLVATDRDALAALKPEDVAGKVILAEIPAIVDVAPKDRPAARTARRAFLARIEELKPLALLDVAASGRTDASVRIDLGLAPGRRAGPPAGPVPVLTLHSAEMAAAFPSLPVGLTRATIDVYVGPPLDRAAKVRNVVGVLRGSDPALRDTYVIVSAHYDHLGIGAPDKAGDRIFNGANDDGSGTVSVIEIASALANLKERPRRSILFAAFYGEEMGLVGSRHFAGRPVVPLGSIVAGVNLEQVGRTDDTEGPRVSGANITGFDYSDMSAALVKAGGLTGVTMTRHPVNSDGYFTASDNAALAQVGIPAHTISVAYAFPDYHGLDDEWERVDYPNMAKVDRMAALGVLLIADDPKAPAWDASNPKTERFRKAKK